MKTAKQSFQKYRYVKANKLIHIKGGNRGKDKK